MDPNPQDTPRHAWTTDPLEGARLIVQAAGAIMSGPAAGAYLVQNVAGVGLQVRALLEDAQAIAQAAMTMSEGKANATAERGGIASFFRQQGKSTFKLPPELEPVNPLPASGVKGCHEGAHSPSKAFPEICIVCGEKIS